jgi:hypothetical protein
MKKQIDNGKAISLQVSPWQPREIIAETKKRKMKMLERKEADSVIRVIRV